MKTILLTTFSVALFLSACADPAANKPKAQTEPASNSSPTAANTEPTPEVVKVDVLSGYKLVGTEYNFGPETSKIEFTGSKVTGKHDGAFANFFGLIDLVGNKAETSKVLFEVDMASVSTDTDGLTKHLQTGDFFEIAKYPKSAFVSTKIVPEGGKAAGNYKVTGDLELRGVKKSITFPAEIAVTPEEITVKAEFSINRKDFGIVYAGKADDLIRDDVVLRLELKAAKKQ